MPTPTTKPKFLIRPKSQYACRADGLCCTSIHGLGPLEGNELVQIQRIDEKGADYDEHFEDDMLKVAPDGGCFFLLPNQYCDIHAKHGAAEKPEGCRKFPLGITRTPEGFRVTTEHRCTCRTMGKRPDLDAQNHLVDLVDFKGKPDVDRDVGQKIRWQRKNLKIPFALWKEYEENLIAKILTGADLDELLQPFAFPRLKKTTWEEQADEFREAIDGTRFSFFLAWVGETISHMLFETRLRRPPRTWHDDFVRIEASTEAREPNDIFADWVADEVWAMKWSEDHCWEVGLADIATRYQIAKQIYHQLDGVYRRPDTAAAEAVTALSTISDSEFWKEVLDAMRPKHFDPPKES